MEPYINTVDQVVTVNKRHYDSLVAKCAELECQVKWQSEIINAQMAGLDAMKNEVNAYHAGMTAQKNEINELKKINFKLNDETNRELECFGYDERD